MVSKVGCRRPTVGRGANASAGRSGQIRKIV
jgi:hypothetical protein